MLQFPSPIQHRSRAALLILPALTIPLGLWLDRTPAPAPESAPPVMISAPTPVEPTIIPLYSELSLQETLDRLGYTVNVPATFNGFTVMDWNQYRTSDESDALPVDQFQASGDVTFQELSMQSMLGPDSRIGLRTADADRVTLFQPTYDHGMWMSASGGPTASAQVKGTVEPFIDATGSNTYYHVTPLYSNPKHNPFHRRQLMVIPARVGGQWVSTGDQTGHWEGGQATGDYLLCWEDLPNMDHDFQDIVILAHGLQPA